SFSPFPRRARSATLAAERKRPPAGATGARDLSEAFEMSSPFSSVGGGSELDGFAARRETAAITGCAAWSFHFRRVPVSTLVLLGKPADSPQEVPAGLP